MSKKVLLFFIISVATIIGIVTISNTESEANIEETIQQNIDGFSVYLAGKTPSMSSNPYDYTIANSYYDNIVDLGHSALPTIIQKIESSSNPGLEEYLLAIAVEEITQINLKEREGYLWMSPVDFVDVWKAYLHNIPKDIQELAISNQDSVDRKDGYIKLGTPAIPFMIDQIEESYDDELIQALEILLDQEVLADFELQYPNQDLTISDREEAVNWLSTSKDYFVSLRELVEEQKDFNADEITQLSFKERFDRLGKSLENR